MKKVNIYIAVHKKCDLPKQDGYIPIHVGAEGKEDLGYLKDNSKKDNISKKNPNYCELTGVYYIWKNVKCDIVGLVHYRRYFFLNKNEHTLDKITDEKEIEKIMKDYDVVLPKKVKLIGRDVRKQWDKFHNPKDLDITREVIKEKYPEYIEAFDEVLKRNYLYPYNMLITKKEIFDEYSKWLFDILFEVEKRVDTSSYTPYEKRLYGFLSERLLNVWFAKNNKYRIKELYVYNIDESYFKQNLINNIKDIIVR